MSRLYVSDTDTTSNLCVQGNCSADAELPAGPPPAVPLAPFQCIIDTGDSLFWLEPDSFGPASLAPPQLWLDRLVLRVTAAVGFVGLVHASGSAGRQLFVTDSAFEGDGGAVEAFSVDPPPTSFFADGAPACCSPVSWL